VASELVKKLAKAKGIYSVTCTSQLFLNFYNFRINPHNKKLVLQPVKK
jgi:hypothetical protein